MILFYNGIASHYEAENIVRLFYLHATIENGVRNKKEDIYCFVRQNGYKLFIGSVINGCKKGKVLHVSHITNIEFTICETLYEMLSAYTKNNPPWGMLTGVRPVSYLRSFWQKGYTESETQKILTDDYKVSADKYQLALQTAKTQQEIIAQNKPMSYSLYISIPFCPSRCSYCSFVSQTTKAEGHLIPSYVDILCQELKDTARIAKELHLQLETVYMGGGTPTSLSAEELLKIFAVLHSHFPMSTVKEFTVEAGRADTITKGKLQAIKQAGTTRISINPQTLNNEVLQAIGRPHSAEDFEEIFHLARAMGFDNINTDLIAGLPKDTPESFEKTINGILRLSPENVTVHTLTLKRASNIVINDAEKDYANVSLMLKQNEKLLQAGYIPYYLYRQKNTLQNLENTGFTKPGKEGYYNIYIMEEIHTILSCGAGGSTKLKAPHHKKIERIFNYKYPRDYINGYQQLTEKKKRIGEFYASYMDS